MMVSLNQTEAGFWNQVLKGEHDECWLWTGPRTGQYGRDGSKRAHRVAWQLANKRRIPPSLSVLHSCDVPLCVNPAHLSIGTQAENMAHKAQRGRAKLAAHHPWNAAARDALGALSLLG